MAKEIRFGKSVVSEKGPCYVIAEIGHNHQGELAKALEMIRVAARSGANAVKFQKRHNRNLYTAEMYDKPYENENSYGRTYGEHREKLEFGWEEYVELKRCAEESGVEFMCAPFDRDSVDFLEKLGITSFKFASGDLTNLPLIEYAARLGKPLFLSTGAATLDEIRKTYQTVLKHGVPMCIFHCVCEYPAEYGNLNLRLIETFKKEFPEAIIGYSSHDNGILAPVIAYAMGAVVLEKHFTLNRAWKGTDHKFSLEPEGLRKQVRDLRRYDVMLGDGQKVVRDYEKPIRVKMGKSLYTARALKSGHRLSDADLVIKTPGGAGFMPYELGRVVGRRLRSDVSEETLLREEHLDGAA